MEDASIKLNGVGSAIIINKGVITTAGVREVCPYCLQENCYGGCDDSMKDDLETEEERNQRLICNAAIDGVESLILALVSLDVVDPKNEKFKEAIQTALDAIANNLG